MPLAEILVLCGFFMIYIVEEVTHSILRRCNSSNSSSNNNKKANKSKENGGHSDRGCDDMLHHVEEEEQEHSFEATLRGFLVILALSLHAVFEGIALGLTSSVKSVWFIFFAIASHKFVISFCVGMQFVTSGTLKKRGRQSTLLKYYLPLICHCHCCCHCCCCSCCCSCCCRYCCCCCYC